MGHPRTSIAIALWRDTVRGTLAPRRLVPVLAVAAPLLLSQHTYSSDWVSADLVALLLIGTFLVSAPFAWRWTSQWTWGWLLYAPIAVLPFGLCVLMTAVGEVSPSFLVGGVNGAVGAGLFLVGGWGLGRDLSLEASLEEERVRSAALEQQARAAELLAVRAHLDPHFLFNTLNAIAEWCAVDPVKAEEAILTLSSLLREVLGGIRSETWPLQRELGIAADVLALHHSRDPSWFSLEVSGDGVGSVPPLLLLPLVENAIKHGPAKGARGTVGLWAKGRVVEVRNPGVLGPRREGGEGLRMVEERLRLAYGDHASFSIAQEGDTVRARIELP